MHTEKPKREMRNTTWALLGLLLMVIGLAGAALVVGTRPIDVNCGPLDDPENDLCAEAQPNQPATLTRLAEEVILTRAVHMVMPTATSTPRPTSIPPTSAPTHTSAPPTRTPVNSIRMAASPIIALRQCQLKTMMDEGGSLVDKLDAYYVGEGGPNNRIARGATLNGPTVFWMEVRENQRVPKNVIPLSVEGDRSVFLIQDGEYTITIGEGGRYISLIVENECPLIE